MQGGWPGQALRCTDASLKGGEADVYQFGNLVAFRAAWQSFNRWWRFPASPAATTCPPSGTVKARENLASSDLPEVNREVLECGLLTLDSGGSEPMYAYSYPANDALVIVQGAPGSSLSARPLGAPHDIAKTWIVAAE